MKKNMLKISLILMSLSSVGFAKPTKPVVKKTEPVILQKVAKDRKSVV